MSSERDLFLFMFPDKIHMLYVVYILFVLIFCVVLRKKFHIPIINLFFNLGSWMASLFLVFYITRFMSILGSYENMMFMVMCIMVFIYFLFCLAGTLKILKKRKIEKIV